MPGGEFVCDRAGVGQGPCETVELGHHLVLSSQRALGPAERSFAVPIDEPRATSYNTGTAANSDHREPIRLRRESSPTWPAARASAPDRMRPPREPGEGGFSRQWRALPRA